MTAEPVSSAPAPFLPLWRRILVTSCVLIATGALAYPLWPLDDAFELIELSILALTAGLLHIRRAEVAVFCRATWWAMFLFGALGTWQENDPRLLTFFIGAMIASGTALVAIGRAGVTPGTGAFAPKVLSSSLVAMMTVALCVAHLLVLPEVFGEPTPFLLVPGALVVAAIGLARTRSWGLFVYLAAMLAAATGAFVVLRSGDYHFEMHAYFNAFGAGLLFVTAVPVLIALVFRRRPAAPGRPWGSLIHAALVISVIALAFLARNWPLLD